jgi:filamentous hemagglutinin
MGRHPNEKNPRFSTPEERASAWFELGDFIFKNVVIDYTVFGNPNATLGDQAFELGVAAIGSVPLAGDGAQVVIKVLVSRSKYGQAAKHIDEAIKAGHPDILTINRGGAKGNRAAAIGSFDKAPDTHLDEYPPAMFKEGGVGASVKAIDPADNMSAGACIGNMCRPFPDGTKIQIILVE